MPQPLEHNKNIGNIWSQYTDITSKEIKNPVAKTFVSFSKVLSYFTIIIPIGVFIADKLSGRTSKMSNKNQNEVTQQFLKVKSNDYAQQSPSVYGRLKNTFSGSEVEKISNVLSNPSPNNQPPVQENRILNAFTPETSFETGESYFKAIASPKVLL